MVKIIVKCKHCKGKNELNEERKRSLCSCGKVAIECIYCKKYFTVEQDTDGFFIT